MEFIFQVRDWVELCKNLAVPDADSGLPVTMLVYRHKHQTNRVILYNSSNGEYEGMDPHNSYRLVPATEWTQCYPDGPIRIRDGDGDDIEIVRQPPRPARAALSSGTAGVVMSRQQPKKLAAGPSRASPARLSHNIKKGRIKAHIDETLVAQNRVLQEQHKLAQQRLTLAIAIEAMEGGNRCRLYQWCCLKTRHKGQCRPDWSPAPWTATQKEQKEVQTNKNENLALGAKDLFEAQIFWSRETSKEWCR